MNSRPKDPKTARNKNVLIVGGSGSGKTRFWLKPNLLQCTSKTYPTSFVVTDPKGDIVVSCGHALQKNGYQIKILNSLNFKKSMHYNPFAYIHSEKDILKLVTTLIANTKGEGKAGDDFWVKAETLLYTALIGYIHYEAPVEEQNFSTLIEFINAMEVREDDEDFKNPVDLMFEELKKRKPDHFAVRQYAKFKLSAGKTAKSILISCGARLAPFDIQELRELTAYDELQLDTLGDRKTALFMPAAIQTARTLIWRVRTLSVVLSRHLMISSLSACTLICPRSITGCIRSFWRNCIPRWQRWSHPLPIRSHRRTLTTRFWIGTTT